MDGSESRAMEEKVDAVCRGEMGPTLEETLKQITLACKHKQTEVLKSLVSNLTTEGVASLKEWKYTDEEGHDAMYYAIRSSDVELVDTFLKLLTILISSECPNLLDHLLSVSYDELRLKNVLIEEEMQLFIQSKVIKLRFYAKDNKLAYTKNEVPIQQRLQLIIVNISTLTEEFSNKKVDSRFICIAKFIAQNMHISKQQLKFTYSSVPWEEIEFCLVCFISAHTEIKEINSFYLTVLRKGPLLERLIAFSKALSETISQTTQQPRTAKQPGRTPQPSREEVAAGIISKYPKFEGLYTDYKVVRDIYSLDIMKRSIDSALPVNPATREGQLTIKRTLQVLGEHLKNSQDSPNLSTAVSDLLLLLAPKQTRDILTKLRNSISHVHFIQDDKKLIEDSKLYTNILNDIKKIATVMDDINYISKINVLKQFISDEFISLEYFEEILRNLNQFSANSIYKFNQYFTIKEHQNIEDLTKEIRRLISDITPIEEETLTEINQMVIKNKNLHKEFFTFIKGLCYLNSCFQRTTSSRRKAKYIKLLEHYFPANTTIYPLEKTYLELFLELQTLSKRFYESVSSRILPDDANKIVYLLCKIRVLIINEQHTINWIDEYKTQLSLPKNHDKGTIKEKVQTKKTPKDVLDKSISHHLHELGEAIGTGRSHQGSKNLLPLVQKNKHNKLRIEALLLDTMSLLEERTKCLSNNCLYLDDNMPLLCGRVLRNYLAHGNPLVDNILSSDSFSTVILNAMILTGPDTEEILILNNGKMGKILTPNKVQWENKFYRNLNIVNNQEAMWKALVEGNHEGLRTCLQEGADLYSRSLIDFSTTLHAAAKGTSVEMVKMLIVNNVIPDSRDINGQTPLHIAAAFGRDAIVKYLVEEISVSTDQLDTTGKTPLHVATLNGHKETVELLLSLGANASIKDGQQFSSLHYATINNFIDLVKVLLDIDISGTVDDMDLTLCMASEHGHAELVQYLLEKGADVNAKDSLGQRPLHEAVTHGHQEVVTNLIKHGAYVNLQEYNGTTPLHLAIVNKHEDIVEILLKKGAFVNTVPKKIRDTPLDTAIKTGHKRIVEILLEYKADVNALNNDRVTPLLSAVWKGNYDIVKLLLEAGAQLDCKNAAGLSALHVSAMWGHKDIVALLIKQGVVIDARNAKQETPLHLAAYKGQLDTVDILLNAGADVCSVNYRGFTPLHFSAFEGHVAVSESLLKHGSNVNTKDKMNATPLHWATYKPCNENTVQLLLNWEVNVEEVGIENTTALHLASKTGNTSVVEVLLRGKADIGAVNADGDSALHLAVRGNHTAIVKQLLDKGADINALNLKQNSALCYVYSNPNTELLDILLAKGADINIEGEKLLDLAIKGGQRHIVEALLKRKELDDHIKVKGSSFLKAAASLGHWQIGRALINKAVKIDSIIVDSITTLLLAVRGGHKEFVDLLLEHGADVNLSADGFYSPLHLAASEDHPDIVESLLLKGAKHDALDKENHTPIEISILSNQLNNLKCFFQHCDVKIDAKNSFDLFLLDIAARVGNVEIVKYLIDQGADLNARDSNGFKAIHHAACKGHVKLVEFFFERGMSFDDLSEVGATLLHLAAIQGHLTLAQFLIDKHVDVNAVDVAGRQPIHYAAEKGHKELVITLLSNGAMFDATDGDGKTPSELTTKADIGKLLESVGDLFKTVNENAVSKTEKLIKEIGKPIEAKGMDNCSVLHLVSEKGFQEILDLLILNGVNPNTVGSNGKSPLHFASEFSHPEIVLSLLQNGAVYNVECENGKTPSDLATQENVIFLLKLVEKSFKKTENCDTKVIEDIAKNTDIGIIKAVLKSRNTQGRTVVDVAIHNNFPGVNRLCDILQHQFCLTLTRVEGLMELESFTEALSVLNELLNERIHLLGKDDPGNLIILENIAQIYSHQSKVVDALSIFENIYGKRKVTLGQNNRLSLWTRRQIAAVLAELGHKREALEVFQEVIAKQKEALGEDHMDLLQTKTHAAQCLEELKNFDGALKIHYEVLDKLQSSDNTRLSLTVQSNIASVLKQQGKFEEALIIFKKVHEDGKRILKINHSITLRAHCEVAHVLRAQGQTAEALEIYREVFAIQKNVLGSNHIDTLHSCTYIVKIYIHQGRTYDAQRIYQEELEHRNSQINDPDMIALDSYFKELKEYMATSGLSFVYKVSYQSSCEMDVIEAANAGDIKLVESLIHSGSDVNTADADGKTPLHFAASGGYIDIVKLLLKSGADATAVSIEGNTALHSAALRGCVDSVGTLLQTVKTVKARAYDDFINAKTVVDGASALHVAAKRGSVDVVKCLLERGAIYNSPDRSNGNTALKCSGSHAVTSVLELAQEMFDCAESGEIPQISAEKQEYLLVVLASKDMQRRTPVQVARFHHPHDHNVVAFLESAQQTNFTLN